jgi:hypothetical protein
VKELNELNTAELAAKYHEIMKFRKDFEEALKNHPDYVKTGEVLAAITQILTQRLHDSGASSINTPHGTVHTVGKTTARIMDPEQFRQFVTGNQLWDMLDWKANMTACRTYIEENAAAVPGVELSTFRRLSITAPKG